MCARKTRENAMKRGHVDLKNPIEEGSDRSNN